MRHRQLWLSMFLCAGFSLSVSVAFAEKTKPTAATVTDALQKLGRKSKVARAKVDAFIESKCLRQLEGSGRRKSSNPTMITGLCSAMKRCKESCNESSKNRRVKARKTFKICRQKCGKSRCKALKLGSNERRRCRAQADKCTKGCKEKVKKIGGLSHQAQAGGTSRRARKACVRQCKKKHGAQCAAAHAKSWRGFGEAFVSLFTSEVCQQEAQLIVNVSRRIAKAATHCRLNCDSK